jgi:folate-binding protein YgfZ
MSPDLEAVERAGGAQPAAAGEADLPARFGDLQSEWTAVRQRCGLLDARFRGLLRLTGADRVGFLQGMLTNDVAKLRPGEGTYAALLTQQGRVVSDLHVYELADELWLDVPAGRSDAVRAALERFIIADDVEFATDDAWMPLVVIEGPQAARVLLAVAGESMEGAAPYVHRELRFDGVQVRVAAASHSGENGYVVYGPPPVASKLWEHCHAAGAEPVGMDALNVLRVEAGMPWYGRDMDESMLISEVGIEQAISYQKGCYLGQEVVERIAARGQVHRKLMGLVCAGTQVPSPQAKLAADGQDVGWVTSAVWSPARQAVIALGYVRRECWEAGTELRVTASAGETSARVVPLPFYSRC